MRVIAGRAKGRKLKAPKGRAIRPTGDKVKGAVFNVLTAALPGCAFLDLFAGSGAMGIEAWSRGAGRVTFVEKDRQAFRLLQENLAAVGFRDAQCYLADFRVALERLQRERFHVVYADPPYAADLYPDILASVASARLLCPSDVLCLEHPCQLELNIGQTWRLLQHKRYGDTAVTFLSPDF